MYTPPNFRAAAAAYRTVGAESAVASATPHQLINMLFEGLMQALNAARGAMSRGDLAAKGVQIQRSVRLLEEGLKAGLDEVRGGELASRLRALYDYCIARLTHANARNDGAALAEVVNLISPLAASWKQIGSSAAAQQA